MYVDKLDQKLNRFIVKDYLDNSEQKLITRLGVMKKTGQICLFDENSYRLSFFLF